MSWRLSVVVYKIGRFFFWLTILMLVSYVVEMLLLPKVVTVYDRNEVLNKWGGGACYVVIDGVPTVKCSGLAFATVLIFVLNVPVYYLMQAFFSLGMAIWFLTDYGRASFNPLEDGGDLWVVISTVIIWLMIVPTIVYYMWHSLVLWWKKIREAKI